MLHWNDLQQLVCHRTREQFILLQGNCQGSGIFFQNPVPILIDEYNFLLAYILTSNY